MSNIPEVGGAPSSPGSLGAPRVPPRGPGPHHGSGISRPSSSFRPPQISRTPAYSTRISPQARAMSGFGGASGEGGGNKGMLLGLGGALAGAGIGFLVGGPIGAIIGGLIGLLVGVFAGKALGGGKGGGGGGAGAPGMPGSARQPAEAAGDGDEQATAVPQGGQNTQANNFQDGLARILYSTKPNKPGSTIATITENDIKEWLEGTSLEELQGRITSLNDVENLLAEKVTAYKATKLGGSGSLSNEERRQISEWAGNLA